MADETKCSKTCSTTCLYIVAGVVTFLLMTFLVKEMVRITQPAPLGAARGSERAAENAKIRAEGSEALKSWGYADQPRGIVRLPIDEAMKITVQGYQNPAAFRADVLA